MSIASTPRLYAVPPVKRSAAALRAAADRERAREKRAKNKVDQVNRVLDLLDARTAAVAREIARLQKRKAALVARFERIESRTIQELEAAGVQHVDGLRSTLTARPAAASVDILDESLIPEHLCKTETTVKPLKALIKAELARGVDVPGVRLLQTISLIRKQAEPSQTRRKK